MSQRCEYNIWCQFVSVLDVRDGLMSWWIVCAKIQCFQNVQCMPFELFVVFVDEFGLRRILFRLSAVQLYKQPTPVNLHADAIAMHHLICTKRDISMKIHFCSYTEICTGWRLMARAHLCTVLVRALWRCSLLFVPHGFDVSPRPDITPREMGWILCRFFIINCWQAISFSFIALL